MRGIQCLDHQQSLITAPSHYLDLISLLLKDHPLMTSNIGIWKACVVLFVISDHIVGLKLPCTPSITIHRSSRVIQTQGMSISLKCPVHLCYYDYLPNVTWCRIVREQCKNVEPDDRITSWWEDKIENEAIQVLRIHSVQLNDSGLYKCTATFMAEQIVGRVLEVAIESISEPSVSLELNGDGFPECRASGRGSPANISWIPLPDDINVTTTENPDNSWMVISTNGINDINVTSVICLVSHPTFKEPWIWSISLTKSNTCEGKKSVGFFWITAAFVVFVVSVIGLCVYTTLNIKFPRYKWSPTSNRLCQWGLSRFRSRVRTEDPPTPVAPVGEEDNKVRTSISREPE